MAYIKCPKNDDRGTWYFEGFCNDRAGLIRNKSPRFVYCRECPNYGANKEKPACQEQTGFNFKPQTTEERSQDNGYQIIWKKSRRNK